MENGLKGYAHLSKDDFYDANKAAVNSLFEERSEENLKKMLDEARSKLTPYIVFSILECFTPGCLFGFLAFMSALLMSNDISSKKALSAKKWQEKCRICLIIGGIVAGILFLIILLAVIVLILK